MNRYRDTSRTASTVSKENSTVTGIRRLAARIGIRKPQSATHGANPSGRRMPRHPRTRSGGDVALIQNLRSAGRDHSVIPFASNRIADAVVVGLNAPTHRPRVKLAGTTRTFGVLAGLLLAAAMVLPGLASADEEFHVKTFSNQTATLGGAPYTQAGGHPDLNTTEFSVPRKTDIFSSFPVEIPTASYVNPPLGFIGNPTAAPRCPLSEVRETDANACPSGSRIGVAVVLANAVGTSPIAEYVELPLYNLVPESGYPAQFGFRLFNIPTVISAFPPLPRTESYGLTVGTPNIPAVYLMSFSATFCGYGVEGAAGGLGSQKCKSPAGFAGSPFLSNPLDCAKTDPKWSVALDSAEHAGALRALGIPDLSDPDWKTATDPAPPVTGCAALVFDPSIATTPLQGPGPVQADQPTGLRVALDFPQTNDPTDVGAETDSEAEQTPPPKDITVKLPAGLSISPSSADGLQACSDQASDPAGDQVHYDTTNPVSCPDAAKIGTATALSPLLALHEPESPTDKVIGPDPIPGDVYLLKPHPGDLPLGGNSDGRFRLLIELENPRYGVNIKLPGIATADKATGQLTATFTQNPQLPASHLTVDLKEGARAPLMTPVTCGKYETTSEMVPWGTPDVPDAHPSADFNVGAGPNGSACPASAAARPFAPALAAAGTENDLAGASSPFVLKLTRSDGEKELSKLDLTLPEGLSAKLAGIPACPEATLAAAATRSGSAEQANPSCPASRIGSVKVGAGPGTDPFFAAGEAYLAGPYKGAPLSVAVITPAVAGPFDLGAIVTRNALFLNPATAQAHVVSDPLPTMLDGIPLRLRTIIVKLDRPDFTLNPTDCTATQITATLTSVDGTTSSPTQSFQASACDKLGFKPTLKLSLKGKVNRRAHPSLQAHLTARPGDANIARAQVKLPKAAFLDNAHIGDVCTRVQFAAKQCPPGSIYGTASATTPLLDYPLTGNVYLRSSSHELPDLVVGFNGPSSQPIEVELAGKTDAVKGALRNTFEAVPDVPVTEFNLTLFGGKKGLIIMSAGFCEDPRASFKFTGQNGAEYDTTPKVAAKCGKGKSKGKAKGKPGGKRRLASFPGW